MKFNKIIIDGNNLYARSFYVAKKISEKEVLSKTLELFMNSLDKLERLYAGDYVEWYFCWDNAKSKIILRSQMDQSIIERKKIDPEYKANRTKKGDIFYNGIDYLRFLLQNRRRNYYDLRIQDFEADDTVKALIDYINKKNIPYRILIVSEDLDWSRLIDDNIFWYAKDKIWDKEIYKDTYGFYPIRHNIEMYKTFRGDKSDNIPVGLRGIREKDLLKIINDFKDIYSFFTAYHTLPYLSDIIKKRIKEDLEKKPTRLRQNYQLVSFIKVEESLVEENLIEGKKNIENLKKMYSFFKIDYKRYEKDLCDIKFREGNGSSFFVRQYAYRRK